MRLFEKPLSRPCPAFFNQYVKYYIANMLMASTNRTNAKNPCQPKDAPHMAM